MSNAYGLEVMLSDVKPAFQKGEKGNFYIVNKEFQDVLCAHHFAEQINEDEIALEDAYKYLFTVPENSLFWGVPKEFTFRVFNPHYDKVVPVMSTLLTDEKINELVDKLHHDYDAVYKEQVMNPRENLSKSNFEHQYNPCFENLMIATKIIFANQKRILPELKRKVYDKLNDSLFRSSSVADALFLIDFDSALKTMKFYEDYQSYRQGYSKTRGLREYITSLEEVLTAKAIKELKLSAPTKLLGDSDSRLLDFFETEIERLNDHMIHSRRKYGERHGERWNNTHNYDSFIKEEEKFQGRNIISIANSLFVPDSITLKSRFDMTFTTATEKYDLTNSIPELVVEGNVLRRRALLKYCSLIPHDHLVVSGFVVQKLQEYLADNQKTFCPEATLYDIRNVPVYETLRIIGRDRIRYLSQQRSKKGSI